MGLFNRHSSIDNVQFKMLLTMEVFLEEVQKQYTVPQKLKLPKKSDYYDPEEPERIKELKRLGFDNVDEVTTWEKQQKAALDRYNKEKERVEDYNDQIKRQIEERKKLIETFKFFLKARDVYGKNTIILPIDKFFEILDKYGLVCGTFSDYCGNVPQEKMEELHFLSGITQHVEGISTLYPVSEIITSNSSGSIFIKAKSLLTKFPFTLGNLKARGWRNNIGWEFIGGEKLYSTGSWDWTIWHKTDDNNQPIETKFFIAAAKEVMKSEIVVREITPVQKDPMICLLANKYDSVIITARWGVEAKDKMIKKAEDINYQIDCLQLAILKGQLQ